MTQCIAMTEVRVIDPARVRALREAKKWSQVRLGRESGVGQGTVSRIESGETRSPELDTVARLAQALETTVGYLAGRDLIGDGMARVMIRCPKTGRAVPAEMTMTQALFEKNDAIKGDFICPACGEEHAWTKKDAFLEGAEKD